MVRAACSQIASNEPNLKAVMADVVEGSIGYRRGKVAQDGCSGVREIANKSRSRCRCVSVVEAVDSRPL